MASMDNAEFKADATRISKWNCFRKALRQRLMHSEDYFVKHRVLGRYYVAALLFFLFTMNMWRSQSIAYSFSHGISFDSHFFYPVLNNWTHSDDMNFYYSLMVGEMIVQVPGALLIYIISSHKFLTAAVAISSTLHMLTPIAANQGTLMFLIWSQMLVAAPFRVAVLSMWKDWAPPGERTKFVVLSFTFWIFTYWIWPFTSELSEFFITKESFYISGVCGLCWCLLWFFTVSDTPAHDPQIQGNKQVCPQNSSLPTAKGRPKLSEVPWKSILTSKPVLSLCLLYFKIGSSFLLFNTMIKFHSYSLTEMISADVNYAYLLFGILFAVVLFISTIITDFLSRKFPRMIKIRKGFLCGALIFHAIILLGALFRGVEGVFYWLSYIIFSIALPGFFTNALDLSSQYVSIIGGFIETFCHLAMWLSHYILVNLLDYPYSEEDNPYTEIICYEAVFAIIAAVVFLIWGSLNEQPWSSNSTSGLAYDNRQAQPVQEEQELREA